jgi:hypothetical protein
MTPSLVEEERLDVPPEQRRTVDLVKRIRKLRWMGMEQEAAKLQLILARFPPADVPRDGLNPSNRGAF